MRKGRFRIVLHSAADAEPHLDLFILFPNRERLTTYTICGKQMERYFSLFNKNGGRFSLHGKINKNGSMALKSNQILATRKEDHRLLYYSFVGNLSEKRGSIKEMALGRIVLPFPAYKISLTKNSGSPVTGTT